MKRSNEWNEVESINEADKLVCSSCGANANFGWSRCRSCHASLDDAIPMARKAIESGEDKFDRSEDSWGESGEDEFDRSEGSWDECPSCGTRVSPDWVFCRSCEYSLKNNHTIRIQDSVTTSGGTNRSSEPNDEVPADDTESSVPDQIPSGPRVSVDYDALTDRESIGGGGNADVTKATLPTPDGDVTLAIKEPRMRGTLHADIVEQVLNEAQTWDKLDNHDHIVGIVDYGSEPLPWIAMEYMDGGHLGERSGEMDIPHALWTAIAVTRGVRHAHRRGVAHLDLKPANVLFRTLKDTWDVPKVGDWGLSKHLLDHSKSVEGLSPHFAAPEQFSNEFGRVDDITDIYQLGAVFYEMFTGQPPFEGNPAEVMRAVMDEEPTRPSEIADLSSELDEILLRALSKEKKDRYESVLLLRNALQSLYDEW